MSSLNIKQDNVSEFTAYPQPTVNANEIDLVNLIEILWRARTKIVATVFAFACAGILVSFLLPQKWTSQAIVTPARTGSVAESREYVDQIARAGYGY